MTWELPFFVLEDRLVSFYTLQKQLTARSAHHNNGAALPFPTSMFNALCQLSITCIQSSSP